MNALLKRISSIRLPITRRLYSTQVEENFIVMTSDSKHIICYHPESKHPYEFTKPIEKQKNNNVSNSVLNEQVGSIYDKRIDSRRPKNSKEFWLDALRLGEKFNESPHKFKPLRRKLRIAAYEQRTTTTKSKRDSI